MPGEKEPVQDDEEQQEAMDIEAVKVGMAFFWLSWKIWVCNDWLSVCGKNFYVVIFSDTINLINVTLCMMAVFIDLCPFIPLSLTLIVFQGHGSAKQF